MSTSRDKTIEITFNLHDRDASFDDESRTFEVAYTLHEPESPSETLPILVMCHHFNGARSYWDPNVADEQLSAFPKITIDAVGFGHSRTKPAGSAWSFDAAAASVLAILDREAGSRRAVIIGDSMGGAHTGLRAALRDAERKERRLVGVVAAGTAAEEESADFVADYTKDAEAFAEKCSATSSPKEVAALIDDFADNMAAAGYGGDNFPTARAHGTKVIADSLKLCLANDEGVLEGKQAGQSMKTNYHILNHRKGLISKLAARPSPLADIQVLVVHGTEDAAYPFERKYHERTATACGEANAEIFVVEGGSHFVTASHWKEVDKKVVEWIERKQLK